MMITPIPPKRKSAGRETRSIAFTPDALRLADKIARKTRRSRSEVVCMALERLAQAHADGSAPVAA
jgi:hypothetical protein